MIKNMITSYVIKLQVMNTSNKSIEMILFMHTYRMLNISA